MLTLLSLGVILAVPPTIGFELLRGENAKFGVVDRAGVTRVPAEYKLLSLDREHTFPLLLLKGRTTLVVTVRGEVLDVQTLTLLRDVRESPAVFPIAFCRESGGCGLLGDDGADVAQGGPFDEVVQGSVMDNGAYYVRRGAQWGLVEWRGEALVAPGFKAISRKAGWPKVVTTAAGMSLLSSKGKQLLKDPVEWIDESGDAELLFKTGGHTGVLRNDGHVLLAASSDEVRVAAPGLFLARKAALWGLLDAKGATRIPQKYEALDGPWFGQFRGRIGHRYTWFPIGSPKLRAPAYGTSNESEPIGERFVTLAVEGKSSLVVDEAQVAWHALGDEPVKGERLVSLALVNRTAERIEPFAADGVPFITIETQGADGTWKSRDDLQRVITCGNSYGVGAGVGSDQQRMLVVRWPPGTKGPVRFSVRVGTEKVESRALAK